MLRLQDLTRKLHVRGCFWGGLFATALCGCSNAPEVSESGQVRESVIWGNLSVKELDNGTSVQREWGTAVGILMRDWDIARKRGDGTPKECPNKAESSFECTAVLSTVTNDLCPQEPSSDLDYSKQSSINDSCTAFMIRQNVFATSAHCLMEEKTGASRCKQTSVILRWRPAEQYPGGNPNVLEQHIYHCKEAKFGTRTLDLGGPKDWAVFTVDRDVSGGGATGGPLTAEREPLVPWLGPLPLGSTTNTVIGHPFGTTTKVDGEVRVDPAASPFGQGTFSINAEAEPGNSGSPVLASDGRVMGILSVSPGPVKLEDETCQRICYGDNGPVQCKPLLSTTNDYRPVATAITQIPAQFLPVVGDFDGNGTQDSVAMNVRNGVVVLNILLNGESLLAPTLIPDVGLTDSVAFASGNFNGDKSGAGAAMDDLILSFGGVSMLFLGGPLGLASTSVALPSSAYSSFRVRDWNHDGNTDLVAQRTTGEWDRYAGSAQGLSLQAAAPAVAGDVDGDGCVDMSDWDIFVVAYGNTVASGADPRADLNKDGKVDDADYVFLSQRWGNGC